MILDWQMESQKLDQHSISMAIKQLAEVITGAEIDGCSSEQISKNLNVISDIISNVALYVLNQPSSEEFDNTVRFLARCINSFHC